MYLRGEQFNKARLLGIWHEMYVARCASLGNDYDANNVTKYDSDQAELIQHPVTGEYALKVIDDTYFPEGLDRYLYAESYMVRNGWLEAVEPTEV